MAWLQSAGPYGTKPLPARIRIRSWRQAPLIRTSGSPGCLGGKPATIRKARFAFSGFVIFGQRADAFGKRGFKRLDFLFGKIRRGGGRYVGDELLVLANWTGFFRRANKSALERVGDIGFQCCSGVRRKRYTGLYAAYNAQGNRAGFYLAESIYFGSAVPILSGGEVFQLHSVGVTHQLVTGYPVLF